MTDEMHEIINGRGLIVSPASLAAWHALRAPLAPTSGALALSDDCTPLRAPRRAPVRPAGTVASAAVSHEQRAGLL